MGLRCIFRQLSRLFAGAAFATSMQSHAADAAEMRRPTLTMGPPADVSAVQGDIVKMQVQYTADSGRVQQVRWAMKSGNSRSISCKEAKCTLRTSSLKPGDYAVYVVVFDEAGSDSMKFDFRLSEAPPKYEPKQIEVPLVKANDDSREKKTAILPVTGQFLRTIEGRAFAHNRLQVRVIGNTPEPLGKLDSIRTANPGVLNFSITPQDEAWILDSSLARIVRNSQQRTFVKLERGTIRVRTLRNIDKDWNLAAGGYVFAGGDRQDTVVIKLPGDELLVASLRGITKVHRESTVKGEPDKDQSFSLNPGSVIRLKVIAGAESADPGRPEPAETTAEIDAIAAVIRKTTPQYLKSRSEVAAGNGTFILNRKPESLQAAKTAARKYADEKDAWLALESLLFRYDEATQDTGASYLVGRSYLDMLLYPEAEEWLRRAIDPARPGKDIAMANEAKLVLGHLAFKRKDWDTASRHFESADRSAVENWTRDKGRGAERKFMIGKSCALSERRRCARGYLPQVAVSDLPAETREEARNLLKKIPVLPGYTLRLSGGLGYNSNIFALKEAGSNELPGTATKNQDGTFKGAFHFDLRGGAHDQLAQDEQRRFGIAFGLDLEKSGFNTTKMASYGRSDYDGRFGIFFTAPSSPGKPTHAFDGTAYVYMSTTGIGSQRVHDEAGGGLQISVPALLGMEFDARFGRAIDPQPPLDQILDPLTGEYIAASDDSGSIMRIKLHLVPFGPDSLTGEFRGRRQLSIDSSLISATRSDLPGNSGDLQITNAQIKLAQKAVDNGILSILAGSEQVKRDLTEEESSELGVPLQRSRIKAGLNYYHEVNQAVHIEASTDYTIGTAQPASFDGFNRSTASLGLHLQF